MVQRKKQSKKCLNKDFGCKHSWEYDLREYCCTKCYEICDIPIYQKYKEATWDPWPRQYLRKDYFKTLFDKISGYDLIYLPDLHKESLIASIPNPSDWYQIYQIFKQWDLQDYWTCWNILIKNKIDMTHQHYNTLLYIDAMWSEFNHENLRVKKKINVFYLLFKIIELSGNNINWIPMRLRPNSIIKLDQEWKLICEKLNLKFMPTQTTLIKFTWNHQHKENFHENNKSYYLCCDSKTKIKLNSDELNFIYEIENHL